MSYEIVKVHTDNSFDTDESDIKRFNYQMGVKKPLRKWSILLIKTLNIISLHVKAIKPKLKQCTPLTVIHI